MVSSSVWNPRITGLRNRSAWIFAQLSIWFEGMSSTYTVMSCDVKALVPLAPMAAISLSYSFGMAIFEAS